MIMYNKELQNLLLFDIDNYKKKKKIVINIKYEKEMEKEKNIK